MALSRFQKQFRSVGEIRAFLFKLGAILLLANLCISFAIYFRTANALTDSVRQQAESYFRLMVIARAWNAGLGGVYVEKHDTVESNQYLRAVGIEPDISAAGGRIFTLRNPATMTREMSSISQQSGGVQFRITSTKPVNPANAPNDFEQRAFSKIGTGAPSVWEIYASGENTVFRYMAPLLVDESCLKCHRHQGYRVGDVRGGISIAIPFDGFAAELTSNKIIISSVFLGSSALLLGILYLMGYRLSVRLHALNEQLVHMSITDELTGIANRRAVMERLQEEYQRARRTKTPLSIMMLDLDHFKQINDTYGHPCGDAVLAESARRVKATVRTYDVFGRYGGEEFLVITPDSNRNGAENLAERIRLAISGTPFPYNDKPDIAVTVSIGVAALTDADDTVEHLLLRADTALYKAKTGGRNRVVSA